MASRITHVTDRSKESGLGMCTRVHGVGIDPSAMNRFMPSNWREVLFVT